MDQYFEITPESVHCKEYFDYVEDLKNERKAVRDFSDENGIETCVTCGSEIFVKKGAKEEKIFERQLAFSKSANGFIPFRKNSKIGKAYAKLNVKHANKPFVPFFFDEHSGLKIRTRLFEHCGKVYCSIDTDLDSKLSCPKGFVEMKASDFFKIIEKIEEE